MAGPGALSLAHTTLFVCFYGVIMIICAVLLGKSTNYMAQSKQKWRSYFFVVFVSVCRLLFGMDLSMVWSIYTKSN